VQCCAILNIFLVFTPRYTCIAPLSIPHRTTCDTDVDGYKIPQGTTVWTNLWALTHDDKLWHDPYVFHPERYLDDDGHFVAADHPARMHNLGFGAGPRVCGGEIFAMTRIFLILTMFMQCFDVLPATSLDEQPSCDCRNTVMGLVLYPEQFEMRLSERD
jgi:cytochrome P450